MMSLSSLNDAKVTTARSHGPSKCQLAGKSANTRRSNAPCSAKAKSLACALHAPRPRSARAGSSDPPCPCGGGASRRTFAGTRGPSAGHPSRDHPNRPSCPRSCGCKSKPADSAGASRATTRCARGAASAGRAAAAAQASVWPASERRWSGALASPSASAACPCGNGGCGAARRLPSAIPSARALAGTQSRRLSWSHSRWDSGCCWWHPRQQGQPPPWSCLRTRAGARRQG
jgi:hypothetical protein